MITLLRKLFIKDYQNVDDPNVRNRYGALSSIICIILNILLIAIKTFAAFYLASQQNWIFSMALIGDTINNIGDLSSSTITLIGFKISNKPADREHPFGHQRSEYIVTLIVGTIILVAAITLMSESIGHLVGGESVDYELIAYIAFGISILVKSLQAYISYGLGKAIDSVALKSVGLDSILDILSSTILLGSAIINRFVDAPWLDGVLGIAVALFVGYSAIKTIIGAASLLMGEAIEHEDEDEILAILKDIDGILGVHDILIHEYGPGRIYVTCHIEVDAHLSLLEAHRIADEAEEALEKKYHNEVVIHVDPKMTDETSKAFERSLKQALEEAFSEVSIHDLQLDGHKVHFDLLLPHKANATKEDVLSILSKAFPDYQFHFHIDHPYD